MEREIFEDDFITWRQKTPVGIKVEEIFGMDSKNGKVWLELARQIFCEQGGEYYREVYHFKNGAPYIDGLSARISISHTDHFFVCAFLPRTPESDLAVFSPRTAMGVDAESLSRDQVFRVREKFLSDEELRLVPKEDLRLNIIAWTSKEALYKAAMTPGLDFRSSIHLKTLPEIDVTPEKSVEAKLGVAEVIFPESSEIPKQEMKLYSYESYGCCVTIAFSPKCAKFGGK